MITILLLAAVFFLYRWYYTANKKWELRGLPGPKPELLFGNLREIWHFDKPRSLVLRDWSKQFGKMYGFYEGQRPFIVVSDFETIDEIIVKKFDHFYPRARFVLQERNYGQNTRIIEARGPHWKRLRALGSLAFTNKSLRNILSTVEHSAVSLVDGMERHRREEINTLQYFQEYTLDVICKVALGMRDVKMFDNQYLASCRAVFYRPLRHPLTVLPNLFPFAVDEIRAVFLNISKIPALKSPFVVLMDMMRRNVEERKAQRANGIQSTGDFIDLFLDAEVDKSEVQFGEDSDTARKLSSEEIIGQCMIFLLAGFDTTSNSLAYTTHFLANHDEVQKKLIDEIDSFLLENETIEVERLNELPYMTAVINESLRHYPLGSTVVTRECAKACEIGGFKFEVGDQVATDTWTMHMDEKVWGEDAKEFRPERWLEESSRPRSAFQSFGEGPRMCLGMRLAYIEEKLALLKLLSRFTIEKTSNTNPLKLVGSMTVSPEKMVLIECDTIEKQQELLEQLQQDGVGIPHNLVLEHTIRFSIEKRFPVARLRFYCTEATEGTSPLYVFVVEENHTNEQGVINVFARPPTREHDKILLEQALSELVKEFEEHLENQGEVRFRSDTLTRDMLRDKNAFDLSYLPTTAIFYQTLEQMEHFKTVKLEPIAGFHEDSVDLDRDAARIHENWEQHGECLEATKDYLRYLPSTVIRDLSTGEAVSWNTTAPLGQAINQFTVPKYRRRGLARLTQMQYGKILGSEGLRPFKYVQVRNWMVLEAAKRNQYSSMWEEKCENNNDEAKRAYFPIQHTAIKKKSENLVNRLVEWVLLPWRYII